MYPEFFCADVTFGVNRQHRELLLVVGIDGNNKVFTGFRCFIPSKQEHPYTWIFNEAMPHLLTNDILKYNQCVSTDNECNLNTAVQSSVLSTKNAFKNSKLRLDCFHFFKKVWLDNVVLKCRDNSHGRHCLETSYKWILSWFKRLETIHEIDLSCKMLKNFLHLNQQHIGEASHEEADRLITKIINKQTLLLHPYFKSSTTFDFIGDSIVESANNPLKKGSISVNANMNLACSALTQVKAREAKSMKEHVNSAKKVNVRKTWSSSLTAQYLTDYAEGIACANFDRRKQYVCLNISQFKWLVIYKDILDEIKNNVIKEYYPPSFMRVRTVHIDTDNFMHCSCQYYKRWLMPCVHMCCVIDDKYSFTPNLFHIRWWKHFNYFFKNGCNKRNNLLQTSTKEALSSFRNHHYDNDVFKGINLTDTPFLDKVTSNISNGNCNVSSLDKELVFFINDHHQKKSPILRGCNKFHTIAMKHVSRSMRNTNDSSISNNNLSTRVVNEDNIVDDLAFEIDDQISNDAVDSMGAGSQVLSQLSNFRDDLDNNQDLVQPNTLNESLSSESKGSFFSQIDPLYKDLLNKIKTKDQLKEAMNTIEKLSFKFSSQSMGKRKIGVNETTFLGEEYGSGKSQKRFKNNYEKTSSRK